MFLPIIIYFIRLTLSVFDLCDNYSTFAYIFAIFIQIVCNICTPKKSSPFSTFFTKNLFFMIIQQNRCSESYHKIPLFLTPFYVDNVDNFVYKSLFALKPFFLMWITFFDLTCTFSAIWSCILRSLCILSYGDPSCDQSTVILPADKFCLNFTLDCGPMMLLQYFVFSNRNFSLKLIAASVHFPVGMELTV